MPLQFRRDVCIAKYIGRLTNPIEAYRSEMSSIRYDTTSPGVVDLLHKYRTGETTPKEVVQEAYYEITKSDTNAWIAKRDEEDVIADAEALSETTIDEKPLYGIPFAIKDNIDFNELPTSAGCPGYTYRPEKTATVVQKLIDAGALLIGKTNMDQFATGLVGTRSPYGICKNVFNENYISGGSSSGSAIAVARGQVPFALGTDTAGSGRIPAALNGIVGLKPTRGVLSNNGVVPGCESLSCISIFARSVDDTEYVERIGAGFDPDDPYSRQSEDMFDVSLPDVDSIRVGVPQESDLEFFGNSEAEHLFEDTVTTISKLFGDIKRVDFSTFEEASDLLYNGPWVAERLTTVGEFIKTNPDDIDLTVRGIIRDGEMYSASDAFEAFHRLEELRKATAEIFENIDALIVPTLGTIYTIEGEQLNPIEINSELGYYTNFVNLIDLCAISIPTGKFDQGPTFSISVIDDAFDDMQIIEIADKIHTNISQPE